jgi:hypothetical protein
MQEPTAARPPTALLQALTCLKSSSRCSKHARKAAKPLPKLQNDYHNQDHSRGTCKGAAFTHRSIGKRPAPM